MRLSLKRISIIVIGVCLLLFFNVWYRSYHSSAIPKFHSYFNHDSFTKSNAHIKETIHYSNYRYTFWDEFTKTFEDDKKAKQLFSADNAGKDKLLGEKCDAFFNYFHKVVPDFRFKNSYNQDDFYDKGIVNKHNFFKDEIHRLIKKRERESIPNPGIITKKDNITINKAFYQRVEQTKATGQLMADTITTLRIFGQCFLNDHGNFNEEILQTGNNKRHFDSLAEKFFFYFNGNLPVFDNLNGTIITDGYPIYENNKLTDKFMTYNNSNENLIQFINKNSNSRGIVISAATKYTRDIMKLIRVLRALNNELPIQVIYKGDLNQRSQKFIYAAARANVEDLLSKEMSSDLTNVLPEIDLQKSYKLFGSTFPKQDITFVNIKPTMTSNHKYFFTGYTNKLLALLFTSFKEVLLLDADSVPLVNPEEFFATEQYKKTGALFFKDRSLRDTNDYIETNYFSTLMPQGGGDTIDDSFGIPPVTSKTYENAYMTGWRHFQEAGVVAIDSYRHFLGILMTLPLALWSDPVKSSIWGDKEMYWLGLSMAGDENYEFNKYHAASIGQVTESVDLKQYPGSAAKEVCSSHPGHVSEEGKLLWINSGFSYCKKNGYFRDRGFFPFSQIDNVALQQLYNNPLRIKDALVPPNLPNFRAPKSPPDDSDERSFQKSWKNRKDDIDEINKDVTDGEKVTQIRDWNPQKGWVKSAVCSNYQYCGYDMIDSYTFDSTTSRIDNSGKVFSFDEATRKKYDYLGKVWISGNNKVYLKEHEPPKKEQKTDKDSKKEAAKDNNEADAKAKEETVKAKEEAAKAEEEAAKTKEENAKDALDGDTSYTDAKSNGKKVTKDNSEDGNSEGDNRNDVIASDPDEQGFIAKQPSRPKKIDISDLFEIQAED